MDDFSLTSLTVTLAILLVVSGVFSLAETAMMAANRYRLKHRAARGERGAKLALSLLAQTDRLLGVILLGNNLINAAAATLTAVIVERLFGEGQFVLAAGTVAVTFAILVFSEITPKVIGATHADRLAPFVVLCAHAAAEAADHLDRRVRQPVRAGPAPALADAGDANPAPKSSRPRSCARWSSRASISAASIARCSRTCSSSRTSPSTM